jgi:hypothetical protein
VIYRLRGPIRAGAATSSQNNDDHKRETAKGNPSHSGTPRRTRCASRYPVC